MATKIQLRRDTAVAWLLYNPILADGEPGYETDTGKQKIGNGVDHWDSLIYANNGSSISPEEFEALSANVSINSSAIVNLEGTVSNLGSEITSTQSSITNIESSISTIESELGTLGNEISSVSSALSALDDSVSDLIADSRPLFLLHPWLTSESNPYIAGMNGESRIGLSNQGNPGAHQTAYIILPSREQSYIRDGIDTVTIAAALHSDEDFFIDTSGNSPAGQPACVIFSKNISGLDCHNFITENAFLARPTGYDHGFILGQKTHNEFEYYPTGASTDSWTVAQGTLSIFAETESFTDGWGHSAEMNDAGALKRYTLSQEQFLKLKDAASGVIHLTYNELKDLKNGTNSAGSNPELNRLTIGQSYVLTDYHTKYFQPNTNKLKIAEHDFNIIQPPVNIADYYPWAPIPNPVWQIKDLDIVKYIRLNWETGYGGWELTGQSLYEKLLLTAASESEFEAECRSLNHPEDIIHYDFNSDSLLPAIVEIDRYTTYLYDTLEAAENVNIKVYSVDGDLYRRTRHYTRDEMEGGSQYPVTFHTAGMRVSPVSIYSVEGYGNVLSWSNGNRPWMSGEQAGTAFKLRRGFDAPLPAPLVEDMVYYALPRKQISNVAYFPISETLDGPEMVPTNQEPYNGWVVSFNCYSAVDPDFNPNNQWEKVGTINDLSRPGWIVSREDTLRNVKAGYDWRRIRVERFLPKTDFYLGNASNPAYSYLVEILDIATAPSIAAGRVYKLITYDPVYNWTSHNYTGQVVTLLFATRSSSTPITTMDSDYFIKICDDFAWYWYWDPGEGPFITDNPFVINKSYDIALLPDHTSWSRRQFMTLGGEESITHNLKNISIENHFNLNGDRFRIPDICLKGDINALYVNKEFNNVTVCGNVSNVSAEKIKTVKLNSIINTKINNELKYCTGNNVSGLTITDMDTCAFDTIGPNVNGVEIARTLFTREFRDNNFEKISDCIFIKNVNNNSLQSLISSTVFTKPITFISEIGSDNRVDGGANVILGSGNICHDNENLVLGSDNNVIGDTQVVIGKGNVVGGSNDLLLGSNVALQGYGNFVIGRSSFTGINRGVVGTTLLGWGQNLPLQSLTSGSNISLPPSINNIMTLNTKALMFVGDNTQYIRSFRVGDYFHITIEGNPEFTSEVTSITSSDGGATSFFVSFKDDLPQYLLNGWFRAISMEYTPMPIAIYKDLSDLNSFSAAPIRWINPVTNKWNDEYIEPLVAIISGGTP